MLKKTTRSWLVVGGLSISTCIILGATLSTLGVFLAPVQAAYGSTFQQVSMAATSFVLAMTLTTPLLGWIIDRIGVRIVMVAGAIVTGTGYIIAGSSSSIEVFILAVAISGVGAGASTIVPSVLVISAWLEEQQALAVGVVLGMASVGAAAFPVIASYVVNVSSWRFAIYLIAALVLCISVPLLYFSARMPMTDSTSPQDRTAVGGLDISKVLSKPGYWLLVTVQMFAAFALMGLLFHMILYLETVGFSSRSAAFAFAATNIINFAGYIILGLMGDRLGLRRTLVIGLAVCALSIPILLGVDKTPGGIATLIVFVLLWGSTCSTAMQFGPLLLAKLTGLRNFGFLYGLNYFLYGIVSALAPMVTGFIFDHTQAYTLAIQVCALSGALALVPALVLSRFFVESRSPRGSMHLVEQ